MSQGTFSKSAGRCAHEPASESVQKPGFMHSTRASAASLPSSFVREHLACGGAIGFHDVGMHTSASATGSALPATNGLDNDPRAGRPCRPVRPSLPLSLPHSSSQLSLPSNPFALFYYEGQHNGAFFMSHWFLSAMTGNLSSSCLTCVLPFFFFPLLSFFSGGKRE